MKWISLVTSLPECFITRLLEAHSRFKDRKRARALRRQLNFHRRLLLMAWAGRQCSFQMLERLARQHGPESLVMALRALADGSVSWAQLRELSAAILHTGNHRLYESAVAAFDCQLSLDSAGSESEAFVGRGVGAGSLNAYRKINLARGALFEKIYLLRSGEYRRSSWFYSNVFHCLRSTPVVVPAVVMQRDGDLLSARYYQFIELQPVAPAQFLEHALRLDRLLYELPVALLEAAPKELFAFTQRGKYKAGYRAAVRFLEENGLGRAAALQELEDYVMGLAKKVSHGDLSPFNLSQRGEVVDWDSCGVDPLGHDLGYAVTRCLEPADAAELVAFFELIWQQRGEDAERFRHDFVFSAVFFAFVYYVRSSHCQVSNETLAGLYRYCHNTLPHEVPAGKVISAQAEHALELADA